MSSAGEEGKNAFAKGDYAQAAELFTKAIGEQPENEGLYSNRSAAYAKLKKLDEALADANKCIELKPDWEKGYSRKGSALYLAQKFNEAVAAFAAGLAKEPTSSVLLTGLQAAQKATAATKKKKKTRKGKKKKAAQVADEELKEEEGADKEEKKAEHNDHVIGIDLGTTYSCVGVWQDDAVKIISTASGSKTIPSYVSFTEDGRRLVGMEAKNQAARNAGNTIYDIKRIIGQRFTDQGVEKDISKFPFKVVKGAGGKPVVEVAGASGTQNFAPEQISSMVLGECKALAEKYLGEAVHKAVITVPAYFNDSQRQATKTAGVIAGLEVLRIINEPTAAALSYGLDTKGEDQGRDGPTRILIFDLGGGTFDVSILSIEDGIFTVVATGGDTRLGGEDFDASTMDCLLAELDRLNPPGDIRKDSKAYARLRGAAELAKRQLSNASSAMISLDSLFPNWHFKYKLTKAKFEALNKGHFNLCMDVVTRVLKDSKFKEHDIDEIVLVGGSTRIPKLQAMLSHKFSGKKLCKSLNPDEAVAYGAAVQGAILNGKRNSRTQDLLLMDVTPLSLGIETTGRVMSVIIPRNTPIPCVKTQVYTTEANYQTKVDVAVYEGERLKSDENNMLGEFTISGIESAKRGEPQVDVSFAIDSDGILNVEAVDRKTGAQAKIEIANRSKVSADDVAAMVADAEKYKAADQERLRKVEAKNELEQAIFEALEVSDEHEDAKVAALIRGAAEKEEEWLLSDEAETAKSSEFALRKRNLVRRLGSRRQ